MGKNVSGKETWMRVVIYENTSGDPETAEKYLTHTEKVLGVFEKTKGCKFGYWAHDPATGKLAAVTYWTGLPAIEAAKPVLTRIQQERETLGIKVVSEDNFMQRKMGQFASPW